MNKEHLPSDWDTSKLGDCCDILDSQRIPVNSAERAERQGDVPYYGANGQQGWIDDHIFHEELVLIAEDGGFFDEYATRPIAYRISGKSWVNNHAHVLRAREITGNGWIFWNLVHRDIRMYIKGGTRTKLNQAELRNIEIPLPPEEEQQLIADILDTIDAAIQHTQGVIDKLKDVRAGLLHDLLTYGIDDNGDLRDPVRHPEQFKPSALGLIPRAWDDTVIENACEIHNNLRKPLSVQVRKSMQGIYPYYGPTGILDYIDEYQVEGEFVLIGEDGDHFLKFDSWEMTQFVAGKFNVNNHAHILKGAGKCRTDWFHHFFKHRDITIHLTRQGAGRFKLNKATLKRLPFAVPNESEQGEIISRLNAQDIAIARESEFMSKLGVLKEGLSNDLLTGTVRVTQLIDSHK